MGACLRTGASVSGVRSETVATDDVHSSGGPHGRLPLPLVEQAFAGRQARRSRLVQGMSAGGTDAHACFAFGRSESKESDATACRCRSVAGTWRGLDVAVLGFCFRRAAASATRPCRGRPPPQFVTYAAALEPIPDDGLPRHSESAHVDRVAWRGGTAAAPS